MDPSALDEDFIVHGVAGGARRAAGAGGNESMRPLDLATSSHFLSEDSDEDAAIDDGAQIALDNDDDDDDGILAMAGEIAGDERHVQFVDSGAEEDDDVHQLSQRVDSFASAFKQSVLAGVSDFRTAMQLKFKDDMKKIAGVYEVRVREAEEHLGQALTSLHDHSVALQLSHSQSNRLLALLGQRTHRAALFQRAHLVFSSWRNYVRERRQKTIKSAMARKFARHAFLRKAVAGWRNEAFIAKSERLERIWKQRMDIASAKLTQEYEVIVGDLRAKLGDAQQEIEAQNKHRIRLEDNLKKAFMRGVCALNMEAMSVLRDNSLQSQDVADAAAALQTMQIGAQLGKTAGMAADNVPPLEDPVVQLATTKVRQALVSVAANVSVPAKKPVFSGPADPARSLLQEKNPATASASALLYRPSSAGPSQAATKARIVRHR